jgi:hypothetical protein
MLGLGLVSALVGERLAFKGLDDLFDLIRGLILHHTNRSNSRSGTRACRKEKGGRTLKDEWREEQRVLRRPVRLAQGGRCRHRSRAPSGIQRALRPFRPLLSKKTERTGRRRAVVECNRMGRDSGIINICILCMFILDSQQKPYSPIEVYPSLCNDLATSIVSFTTQGVALPPTQRVSNPSGATNLDSPGKSTHVVPKNCCNLSFCSSVLGGN